MEIKVKDLKPNPYRDMENYPIDQEKIESLKDSIEQTGFWDNILARQVNGEFQIAYGHHRLEVLKQILKPTDKIDIPVKELSDTLMIQIMANENMDEWKTSPKVIDETVRVAKLFLQEHLEEAKLHAKKSPLVKGDLVIGDAIIARFLNWNETRVYYSLQRLGMIEKEEVEKEAIYDLPTDTSARTFSRVIKKHKIPKQEQKKFAEKIKQTESYGENAMDDVWVQDKYTKPEKKKYRDDRILTLENKIANARNSLDEATDEITDIIRLIKELGAESFNQSVQGGLFILTINRIEKQISQLRNLNLNEK